MKRTPLVDIQESINKIVDKIATTRFFTNIDKQLLLEVFRFADFVKLEANEVLIKQGAKDDFMVYFLYEGDVEVFYDNKFILRLNHPGDIIGEMAVISSGERTAEVRAKSYSEVIGIETDFLRQINPKFLK